MGEDLMGIILYRAMLLMGNLERGEWSFVEADRFGSVGEDGRHIKRLKLM